MNSCRSLLFADTLHAPASRWMPWELGYFDGRNGKVAVFPLLDKPEDDYVGREYLGLYPLVQVEGNAFYVLEEGELPRSLCSWLPN